MRTEPASGEVMRAARASVLALLCLLVMPSAAAAITFDVNTTADGNDFNTADPFCDADSVTPGEQCTLRAALMQADTPPGRDTINVPAGDYALTLGHLVANSDVIVDGAGATTTTIRGTGAMRVFLVNAPGGRLDLRGATVRDGVLAAPGAGIYNETTLILRDSVVKANDVTVGIDEGAGIYGQAGSATTILDSVIGDPAGGFQGNRAERGGGIFADYGALTIRRSVIVGNTANDAVDAGAGVYVRNSPGQTALIEDSELRGNSAPNGSGGGLLLTASATARLERVAVRENDAEGGGGVYTTGVLTMVNSTVSGNMAHGSQEAGIRAASTTANGTSFDHVTFAGNGNAFVSDLGVSSSTTITIRASIFASPGLSCFDFSTPGAITSLGGNVEDGDDCGLDQPSDRPNRDPRLGALAANGGPTSTHALLADSPAVDLVSGACPAIDQRGVSRPQGVRCDSGAYELARCNGVTVNRIGTAGDDVLTGTAGSDGFLLLGGNDRASGGGGDDAVCAGSGDDRFAGGEGNDVMVGETGNDGLTGGPGDDLLLGGSGRDLMFGGGGRDRGVGGAGPDRLLGQAGPDRLLGQAGPDRLLGQAGPDRLLGGRGRDLLKGGKGRDLCRGGKGRDRRRACERGRG